MRKTIIIIAAILLMASGLTCNGDNDPSSPWDEPYDPYRPDITGFTASRSGASLAENIVFSGEDIGLSVDATSKAFPVSCGLDEGDVVQGNLIYSFSAVPPQGINAKGVFSQATPPSDNAVWRVPDVENFDNGEGVIYTVKVAVYDQCLRSQNTGSLTIRVFADQGAPLVSKVEVKSDVNSADPIEEQIDKNGLYEVERGDKCRIDLTAVNRSYPSICENRGIKENEELLFVWDSNLDDINLTFDEFPARAIYAEFDVPFPLDVGHKWSVVCTVTDACTGTVTIVNCNFIVVSAPVITGIDCMVNGMPFSENPFFDTYEVQPGDEVIVIAHGEVMDDRICDSKGIHPDLLWNWIETDEALPSITPEYPSLPEPNNLSRFEFVVPSAQNGTIYNFLCTLKDRCNELTDTDVANFTVIVPPSIELTSIKRDAVELDITIETGRYHVSQGDHIIVRITAASASGTSFCTSRGVSLNPPIEYDFILPWDNVPVLVYDPIPSTEYCDLEFIVPPNAPPLDATMRCRIKDLCNELENEVTIPFRVN